jgi:phenylalanyl-tRNA synthetase beta chain
MAGNEVGEVEEVGANWDRDKVVVGHVLKVDPHPNADRLRLPTVDIGNGETAQVVCGAPNVAAGQKIAFAREGARLYSYRSGQVEPLKAATIRGVVSSGMVCSELELGISGEHEGILVLDDDAPIGTPLIDYIGDAVLDVEVTPNRPDCLSILGIGHEVAALTGATLTEPDLSYPETEPSIEDSVKIEIADPDLCPRYTASLVTGIKVGESPHWMQDALVKAGQRPINNIVDITNYVMLEYGQPLHAFDIDKVKDRTVIIRQARPNEEFVTLDAEKRTLKPPMLVIADSQDAIGLAGIMGGENTEIDENTTTVLLESANFSSTNNRQTRGALGMSTEASYRFERGIRADLAPLALRRATQLFIELAGGKAHKGIIDLYPGRKDDPVVKISRQRIKQSLGVDYEMSRIEGVLNSLGFERADMPGLAHIIEGLVGDGSDDETLWMKVPYWRSDIALEDDLVEEIARIVGYDTVPTRMLSTQIPLHEPFVMRTLRESVKDLLASAGMSETISYSLTNLDTLERVDALSDHPEPLKLANPMSAEFEYMRTSLRGSILRTLSYNRRNSQNEGIRIFEIGSVYLPKEEARERELPDEKPMLVGVLSGPRNPVSWNAPQGDMNFFDAKGVLESVLGQLKVPAIYERSHDRIMHPGKTARIMSGGVQIGVIGEVHPFILERFELESDTVAMFEIDLESLGGVVPAAGLVYERTSRFPESWRDLALVVNADVTSAQIQTIINRHKFVVRSAPFDVYSGAGIPQGKKSVAYRVVFQSDQSTLTSEQVDRAQSDILRQLEREVGAELRG